MKPLLHALMVEDSEEDAILLLRNLERSNYEIAHERVETVEALDAALDRESWDILFCDFTMPGFSGRQALEIVNGTSVSLLLPVAATGPGRPRFYFPLQSS
jgi:CheY-like chemotaxis protein